MRLELPFEPASAGTARRALRTFLDEQGVADTDMAELCTSELVTNALLHGAAPVSVEAELRRRTLRVAVCDAGPGDVRARQAADAASSGRGLEIVATVASRWDVEQVDGGKRVWFELPVSRPEV